MLQKRLRIDNVISIVQNNISFTDKINLIIIYLTANGLSPVAVVILRVHAGFAQGSEKRPIERALE
jgi:hypothetical protein